MAVALVFTGAQLVFAGSITVGQLVAFQMLSGRVTGPPMYFVSLIRAWQEAGSGRSWPARSASLACWSPRCACETPASGRIDPPRRRGEDTCRRQRTGDSTWARSAFPVVSR
jgi:hypothetical protein